MRGRILGFTFCCLLAGSLAGPQSIDPRDRDFWNRKFSDGTHFNDGPSKLLVAAVRGRRPGLAVDLGMMGQGRNAIYLAQQGWRVTGVDLSDVAVAQAMKRAQQIGVKLDAVLDDLDHFDFGGGRWDLIALFYVHAWYHGAKPRSVQRLHDALKPGGLRSRTQQPHRPARGGESSITFA